MTAQLWIAPPKARIQLFINHIQKVDHTVLVKTKLANLSCGITLSTKNDVILQSACEIPSWSVPSEIPLTNNSSD